MSAVPPMAAIDRRQIQNPLIARLSPTQPCPDITNRLAAGAAPEELPFASQCIGYAARPCLLFSYILNNYPAYFIILDIFDYLYINIFKY